MCERILKSGKRIGEMCGRVKCSFHTKTLKDVLVSNKVIEPISMSESISAQFSSYISVIQNPSIVLLRDPAVVQWIMGDMTFLPTFPKRNKTADDKQYKILEDKWGQTTMKQRRPDLKLDKQWTNTFGEYVCSELYSLMGRTVHKPIKQKHFQPDLEVEDAVLEVKTGTFYTSGTAGEKILGTPFKYAELPVLYRKPVKIICIGGAEKICKEQYGNLSGEMCTPQKKLFIDFYRQQGFEYIGASDLIKHILQVK